MTLCSRGSNFWQGRPRVRWLYTRENDTTRVERGRGTDVGLKVLDMMLSKLSSDSIFDDLINPLPSYLPIFMDQPMRSKLLKEMPTLDDIDVAMR
jgi:hypothetical protein